MSEPATRADPIDHGDRERLASLVAALRQPASYPGLDHPTAAAAGPAAIETHMAWVFLTPTHAYKLHKPLVTPWFDHASLTARHRACLDELRLNRRLAASVYQAVVPVRATPRGLRVGSATPEPGGDAGTIVDWLVQMRRLPADRMLDACVRTGTVAVADIDAVGARLTEFFGAADPVEETGEAYRARIAADIARKRADLARPHYGLPSDEIDAVYARLQGWLASHGAQLEGRASKLIDGHGDLRPEHVCLERPPVIIDCLAFSSELRAVDPVAELSFLALECERLGAGWIGERLLDGYIGRTGDGEARTMVALYRGHHALIRAAIAVWHLDDGEYDGGPPDAWRTKARAYLRLVGGD